MTDEQLERHVKVSLARAGYVVAPGTSPFRLEARSAQETLLVQIKGDRPDEGAAWGVFVGAVAQLSILAEDTRGALATMCVVFGPVYESYVRDHLRGLDPQVEVFLMHESGRLERVRRPWPGVVPGPRAKDTDATVDTVVARPRPAGPPPAPEHPDGAYTIADVEYEVRGGRLAWVAEKDQRVYAPLFADVCRRLGLAIEEDSAARVLWRAVETYGGPAPEGSRLRFGKA